MIKLIKQLEKNPAEISQYWIKSFETKEETQYELTAVRHYIGTNVMLAAWHKSKDKRKTVLELADLFETIHKMTDDNKNRLLSVLAGYCTRNKTPVREVLDTIKSEVARITRNY